MAAQMSAKQGMGEAETALAEARARETALRDIIQVVSQSRSNEQPVFDAILRNAAALCNAPLARLELADEARETFSCAAAWGEELRSFQIGDVFSLDEPQDLPSAIRDGERRHIHDLSKSELYLAGDPMRVRMVDEEGYRTYLVVPLISGGVGVGGIVLSRREVAPFADADIALVESFAEQAVIAIDNVRQFRELQTRLEREEATREILEVISRSRDDQQPVFEAVLANAQQLCGAPFGVLTNITDDGAHVEIMADGAEPFDPFVKGWRWPMDSELISVRALRENSVLHVEDVAQDSLYAKGNPDRVKVVETGIRTALAVPLVSKGQPIGSIVLFRTELRPFAEDDVVLVKTFAEQAVIAIENVRQFRELQTRLEREAATRKILEVISHSRADDKPVFDVILQNAAKLCEAPMARLMLANDERTEWFLAASWGQELRSLGPGDAWPLDPKYLIARTILEKETINTKDLADTDLYRSGDPIPRRVVDDEGVRTRLTVPLVSGDIGIGCIVLSRREVAPFNDADVELVKTFAEQAVIAIDNVRQFRELQTRLEREAATREVLHAISQSRDDEQPVFEVILENAARLCHAPHAGLLLVNDDESLLQLVASNSATSRFIEQLRENPHSLTKQDSLAARALRTRQVGHYPDIADDPEGSVSAQHKAAVETEGMRTALLVPLILENRAIGTVFLYKRAVEPFHDDEIALVETFAAQAVIAIENVRQFRELQTRLEREAASREILQVISRSRADEKPVFDVILESASRLCKAPLAFLSMADENREFVTIPALRGARSEFADIVETYREPLKESPLVANRPIWEGKVILSDDLGSDPRYSTDSHRRSQLVDVEGARSLLAVPLLSGELSIGAIVLYRREVAPFSEDDVALVQGFASQAVIAIQNVKQFRELEATTAEVKILNEGLEARVEEQVGEIERMGRLKRFLSPQVADAVVSAGDDTLLSSHRALIATLFCDMRGFTAFCETAEPEETIEVLQTYHEEMGKLMSEHGAGVDHRMGDGIMVIFNDPLPCDDPAGDALKLGIAMRDRMAELGTKWRRLGFKLGFGVGISLGYATVGMVGSEGRYEYTANGTAVNLAARLCDKARDGEILLSPRAYNAVEEYVEAESSGEFDLKGIKAPVEVFRVTGLRTAG